MAAPHWLAQMAICLEFKDAHRGKTHHKALITKYLTPRRVSLHLYFYNNYYRYYFCNYYQSVRKFASIHRITEIKQLMYPINVSSSH